MQTLQFIKHMMGDRQFTEKTIHLLSDYAMTAVLNGERDRIWAELEDTCRIFRECGLILIEISSLREFSFARPDGSRFYANTFSARDMNQNRDRIRSLIATSEIDETPEPELSRLTAGQTFTAMRDIQALLGAVPIVWISHIQPVNGDPSLEIARTTREQLSDTLSAAAAQLGHYFIDPTETAREVGHERFFRNDGKDIDHLSDKGAAALAVRYRQIINTYRRGVPAYGDKMTREEWDALQAFREQKMDICESLPGKVTKPRDGGTVHTLKP